MFGSIGGTELIVILVVALLIFGPRKLPSLGRSLGKGLAELRRASTDLKSTLEREIQVEESSSAPATARVGTVPVAVPAETDSAGAAEEPVPGTGGDTPGSTSSR